MSSRPRSATTAKLVCVTLLIDDENRVRTLTLNRPQALNAFSEALYDATAEALNAAVADPEVAVVMITGA